MEEKQSFLKYGCSAFISWIVGQEETGSHLVSSTECLTNGLFDQRDTHSLFCWNAFRHLLVQCFLRREFYSNLTVQQRYKCTNFNYLLRFISEQSMFILVYILNKAIVYHHQNCEPSRTAVLFTSHSSIALTTFRAQGIFAFMYESQMSCIPLIVLFVKTGIIGCTVQQVKAPGAFPRYQIFIGSQSPICWTPIIITDTNTVSFPELLASF